VESAAKPVGMREDGRNPFRTLGTHDIVQPTEVAFEHFPIEE
jgi:hypothetical protein